MARSDPEKLAEALRANLRRRKGSGVSRPPAAPDEAARKPPEKPQPPKG